MKTGKAFELVERARVVKRFGIHGHGGMRGVATGAPCGVLFELRGVWRAVGAEEKLRRTAGRRFHQSLAMRLAFQHRQAVVMRANATRENGVAVVQQVVRRDGRARVFVARRHILRSLCRGDVLEHNFEFGKVTAQRNQLGVDEHRFAVKQVNVSAGHLAVHQQEHARLLHGFECLVGLAQVGHTRIAVGGGTGWVELGGDHTCVFGTDNFVSRQVVGEVERHQRLEAQPLRNSRQDALFVSQRLRRGGHGGLQVGHDDGAAKFGGGMGHHRVQCSAIAHMQVPVVGAGDGEFLRHVMDCLRCF